MLVFLIVFMQNKLFSPLFPALDLREPVVSYKEHVVYILRFPLKDYKCTKPRNYVAGESDIFKVSCFFGRQPLFANCIIQFANLLIARHSPKEVLASQLKLFSWFIAKRTFHLYKETLETG